MNQQSMPSAFFRKFMILSASVICVFYLAYRAIYTFNLSTPYAVFASVFLYVGEFFGIMNLLLYFLQVWEVNEPPVEPVLEGRTVDVLVPTYNEDPQLLRATLEACIRMDYPHKTYVLDDGHRPEVEVLARELGVIYISRPDNRHAKAGNLNNALEQTGGEFVVVLDADHVPEPHFITRLIGYFRDDRLAFVQTPHAFYNFDSFQARLDHKNRRYWEEGDLFYKVIQPGRNKWNAPIFAGSAAMFRRNALKEIGYIATETITEDMHTGLRLHGRGWKSIAISERLIAGQAPPDITTFHSQRLRWGEGNLSIMAYDNPLFMAGLAAPQRFCYFGSMIHWASGLFKLAIYLTPILMLFTGVPPVREFNWTLIVVSVIYLFFSLYAMKVVSNGYGSIINSELFSMVNFWTQTKATFRAIFRRRRQRFVVTSKRGPQTKSVWPYVRPQTYLILLSVLAIVWGWLRLSLDVNPIRAFVRVMHKINIDQTNALANAVENFCTGTFANKPLMVGFGISDDYFKPVVPTIWCLIFFWLAYKVTQRAFWPANRRFTTRHQVHLPVEYEVVTPSGVATHFGVTVDLNDSGMAFVAYEDLPLNSLLRFTVHGAGETIKLRGELRSAAGVARSGNFEGHRYGVQFKDLTSPQIDAINRICYCYAAPRMFDEYDKGNRDTFWSRIRNWQSRGMAQRRNAIRNTFHLPLVVNTGTSEETTMYSTTEDISRIAAAGMFENEMPLGSQVGYLLPTPLGEVRGTATVIRSQPTVVAGRTFHRAVLEFREFEGQGRTTLQSLVNPTENASLAPALKPDKKSFLPNMRVPIIVGLLIAIPLILLQMGIIFPFYYKEDQFLRKMIDARDNPKDEDVREYKRILGETLKQEHPSTDRLVLLMTLGNKLKETGDLEQLTQYLAVRDQKNLSLSKALVIAYDNTQKYAEAEREYERLKTLADQGRLSDVERKELDLAGARVAVHSRKNDLAIKRFRELYKEDQTPELRNEFAGVCNSAGQYDEAIQILEAAPNLDNQGRKYLIAALYHKGRFGEANQQVAILRKDTKDSIESMQLQADLLSAQKNLDEQLTILKKIKERLPNPEPEIQVKLAQAYIKLNNYDQAIDEVGALFSRSNYPVDGVNAFVEAASRVEGIEPTLPGFDQARHDKVLHYANQLYDPAMNSTSSAQDHALYLTRLGWVYQRLGDGDKSSRIVTRALGILPQDDNVRQQLAGILLQSGRPADAARVLGEVKSLEARKLLTGIYLEQKDFDKAIVTAKSIAEDEKNWKNEKFIADILSWKGGAGFDEAIKIYEKHLQQEPGDVEAQARVAEIALWAKYYNEAVTKYQALLETENLFRANAPKFGDGFIAAASSAKELNPVQITIAQKLADQKLLNVTNDPLAVSRLAWVMIKAKDRERAEKLLSKVVVDKNTKPEVRKEIAGTMAEAGQYKNAIALLDAPQTDSERLVLARLYAGAKEWAPALKQTEVVLANNPADPEIVKETRILQADIMSYQANYAKALEQFAQLKLLYPADRNLDVREAEVTLWSRQFEKALPMFQALYDKYPTEPKIWLGFASAASDLGALNTSQKTKPLLPVTYATTVARIADRVLNTPNVNDPLLLGRLAVALTYINDPQKADLFMNRALALKNRDTLIRRELANSLALMKRYKDAIDQYAGIEMTPEDRIRLIDISTSGEDLDLAVREARFLVNHDATNRNYKKLLADVLSWRGDFAESLSLYEQLMREKPKDADLLLQMADVTLWWRHYPDALVRFGELLNVKGDESRVYFGFIDAASSAPGQLTPGQTKQALQVYEQYKDKINDPGRLARLAWIMIKTNNGDKADVLLNRALAMKSPVPEVRRELAGALAGRERIDDAIAQFTPIEQDLNFDERITFAVLLTSSGTRENLNEAERQFQKLLASPEKPKDATLRIRYAEMLLWSGKYDKKRFVDAQRIFEELMKDIPSDPRFPIRVAQCVLWSGKYNEAMVKFTNLMDNVYTDPKLDLDVWMGYVDSVAGSVGEVLRKAGLENESPEKYLNAFLTEQVRQNITKAYQRSAKVKPEPKTEKVSEKYLSELKYYTESLARLGMSLGLMGEKDRSRETFEKAISLNRTSKEIWELYANSLKLQKEYAKAQVIYDALIKDQIPDELPKR